MNFENKNYVHLHCHSTFSLFDSTSTIKEVVGRARELGFPALAITDHGNIGGWIKFIKECTATKDKDGKDLKTLPIKPILGCLLHGQEIITENGVKEVQDIIVGDRVLTHRGRYKKVLKVMKRVHEGYFFKIKLANYKKEIVLTDEHPILVSDNVGDTKWVMPPDIINGRIIKKTGMNKWKSYVCFPKLSLENIKSIDIGKLLPKTMKIKKFCISKIEKSNKYDCLKKWDNISRFIKVDEELAYFLGLFCAEGWTRGSGLSKSGLFGLCFNIKEKKYVDFCVRFLKERFKINTLVSRRLDHHTLDISACCVPMSYILANLCGEKARGKKVPSFIFKSPRNIKEKFVKGLLDGDGKNPLRRSNVGRQRTLRVASRNLAWGFRVLAMDMGHWVSVSTGLNKISNKIIYSVSFNPYRKYSRSFSNDKYIFKPIFEISKFKDSKEVFNFEVEEDNSYVGEFILHNCEFYMSGSRFWKTNIEQTNGQKGNYHINLFAKNFEGYKNICHMSEKSWLEGFYFHPRIDLELMAQNSKGVMCSSACIKGIINTNLLYGKYDAAKKIASIFKDIYGEDFFLEVMYHGMDEEKIIIPDIFKLGKELDIKIIATQDSHYTYKNQAKSQEVLLCMSTSSCLTNPKHLKFPYDEFYMKSAEEMAVMFSSVPSCIFNTVEFANRIDADDISKNLFRSNMRLPNFDIPQEFKTSKDDFENRFDYLKSLVKDGIKRRGWDRSQKHIDRVKMELEDTRVAWENNGYDFVTYYLIEYDLMRFANEKNILTGSGRGSGYSSVILHCLGICSGLDPLEYGLLWQRFLGFEGQKYIKASDFGFEDTRGNAIEIAYIDDEEDILDEYTENEDIFMEEF